MSKILITGNGFDLYHGLPTKYGHFMAIMKTIEEFDFSKEISFIDLFERYFKRDYLDDYDLILKNYNIDKIKFDINDIDGIEELIKDNSWYKHFKRILEIDTWIDLENEIENVLTQISVIIKHTENKTTGRNNYFDMKSLNLNMDFSIFNFCITNRNSCFIGEHYINSRTDKFNGNKVLNELENSLIEFIKIFNNYLSKIVVKFYDNYLSKSKIPLQYIDFYYTFNYTPTVEKIYNKSININYLHGEIDKDEVKQNLVLGIDEIPEEIVLHKAFGFSKYYQKIINSTDNFLFKIPNENTHITEENIFYIFGHSLDRSDKENIGRIFDFIENDYSEQSNIIVFLINDLDKKNKLKNLFSFIKKETIVKLNDEGRLSFVEINNINLEREFRKELWRKYNEDYSF